MPDYKALYLRLFGAVEDALEHLERRNVGLAIDRLTEAEREAEEAVVSDGDGQT